MEITAKELRTDTKHILDAIARGEEVIVTYRGKPWARMTSIDTITPDASLLDSPLFGIWEDHEGTENVQEYVDRLRTSRR